MSNSAKRWANDPSSVSQCNLLLSAHDLAGGRSTRSPHHQCPAFPQGFRAEELNHGEAYQRLRSAISSVPGGKFRLKTQAEQQIWQDSARLIARAINYYNTLLISHVAERQREAANAEPLEFLKCVSPVAWRHITLIGSFDFTASSALIDLEALAARFYLFGAMGSNSQF